MWRHAALDEVSTGLGLCTGTAAADLSKFYERIGHQLLIQEARAVGYPIRLLCLNVSMYRGERRCRLEGTVGAPVWAGRTFGAGCTHAHGLAASPCRSGSRRC